MTDLKPRRHRRVGTGSFRGYVTDAAAWPWRSESTSCLRHMSAVSKATACAQHFGRHARIPASPDRKSGPEHGAALWRSGTPLVAADGIRAGSAWRRAS